MRERDPRHELARAAGRRVLRQLAGVTLAASLQLRLPRRAARVTWAGDEPADGRARRARASSADQLPQVRAAQRRARRLGLELALAREASRLADAFARLDVLAVRGDAFRDFRPEALRRGRRDLVRRVPQDERAAA